MRSSKRLLAVGLAISLVQSNGIAMAGIYDAVCGGIDCKISLDGKGFTGPNGFIPQHRIAQWYTGGFEEHNKAASAVGATGGATAGVVAGAIATCWTVVLCLPGLIGGGVAGGMGGSQLGKDADFYFTVIGYDKDGKKTIQSFNFVNKKPVGKLIQEFPMLTGLAMGELRTIKQIKEADRKLSKTGGWREMLPFNIGPWGDSGSNSSLPESL